MKRCPECKRFGIEVDFFTREERCLWNDCLWVNTNNRRDLDKENLKRTPNFKKFRESIRLKVA